MFVTHSGETYECAVAVKCENDKYIKLYDAAGTEIASFYGISDFSDYEVTGGSFVEPCNCAMPIALSAYTIGGRTITTNDWILSEDESQYYYEIESGLITANKSTCNVGLLFAPGTELEHEIAQDAGKLTIYTSAASLDDIVIESIQIIKA